MIKIKLEQWKEVVRLEYKYEYIPSVIDDFEYIAEWHERGQTIRYIDSDDLLDFRNIINEYNNSICDDSYRWICDGCNNRCKSIHKQDNVICTYSIKGKTNWQQIYNIKIEIIEDKE
jgi:hypothetical protein